MTTEPRDAHPARRPAAWLTHMQLTILEYVTTHEPVPSAQIAQAFGMAHNTARQHLLSLRKAGRVKPTSKGPTARWKLHNGAPDIEASKHAAVARSDETSPIWQCPSIWAYAQRMQTLDNQSRTVV